MSIITDTAEGWLLCHRKLSLGACQLKSELFDIRTPFCMDSAAQKIANAISTEKFSTETTDKKRKRKRNDFCMEDLQNLGQDKTIQAFQELIMLGYKTKYFNQTPLTKEDWLENNKSARSLSLKLDPGSHLFNLSEEFSQSSEFRHTILNSGASQELQLKSLTMIESQCAESVIVSLAGQKYIIPPKSAFILGDVLQALKNVSEMNRKYDFVLMDPPWLNKSVKRKKRYKMMETEHLQKLPIPDIAKSDCLIAVWTTNNSEQNAFVRDVLFPTWSVIYLSTWKWIKVTLKGTPIASFQSAHKKPYENLVLGRFKSSSQDRTLEDNPVMDKIFVSIPSIIHSHKPPIFEIVKSLVKASNPLCLELFARYLLPHWTSCGKEVLKLQHTNYYNNVEK